MRLITPPQARAYVNHGRWVADCPVGCGGALSLNWGEVNFYCPECHTITPVEWPPNVDEIMEELEKRVNPRTRNWFPKDHEVAVRGSIPHGQTVEELREEREENESWPGQLP